MCTVYIPKTASARARSTPASLPSDGPGAAGTSQAGVLTTDRVPG
jgi:hypothetical protein